MILFIALEKNQFDVPVGIAKAYDTAIKEAFTKLKSDDNK